MAGIVGRSDFLVSSDPNDALLFSVNEHEGVRTEQDEGQVQVQLVPDMVNAESSCAMTKAIEVCVNGVKQVVIVPMAQSGDDIVTVSSTTSSLPCVSMERSSGKCSVVLDDRPDDVKLLAESCVAVTSSSYFSAVSTTVASSPVTSVQISASLGPTSLTMPLMPSQQLPVSGCAPLGNLPSGLMQNPYVAAAHQLLMNSVDNRVNPPSYFSHCLSRSFPGLPNVATSALLPVNGYLPTQQLRCTGSLQMSLAPPVVAFQANRNVVPDIPWPGNQLTSYYANQSTVAWTPWSSYNPVQARPLYGGINGASNAVASRSLQPGFQVAAQWQTSNMLPNYTSNNYENFLSSLQHAINPYQTVCQSPVQSQDYIFRKRGVSQQNIGPNFPVCSQAGTTVRGSYLPQCNSYLLQRRGLARGRLPVNRGQVRTSFTHEYMSYLQSDSRKDGAKPSHSSCNGSVQNNYLHSISSLLQTIVPLCCQSSDVSSRPFCQLTTVSSTLCRTIASTSTAVTAVSRLQPETGIPICVPYSTNVLHPTSITVTATATSAAVTQSLHVNETLRTTVMQPSVEYNSTNLPQPLKTILSDLVASEFNATTVCSNCSLTTNASLTDVMAAELYPLNCSSSSTSLTTAVTESHVAEERAACLAAAASQSAENSSDLGSLPADVVNEMPESESLLLSFCNLFEQPNTAQLTSSEPVAASVENGLHVVENRADVRPADAHRALQIAKSWGKGRHFAEEARRQRQERMKKKRRRVRLTALEDTDESSSSDSWHPDSYSESSEYQSPSSPVPSPASSLNQASDESDMSDQWHRKPQTTFSKQSQSLSQRLRRRAKQRTREALESRIDSHIKKCSVVLEQLQMRGLHSVNVRFVNSLMCCPDNGHDIPVKRRLSTSDSDCSIADLSSAKKIRNAVPRIEDTDSSVGADT